MSRLCVPVLAPGLMYPMGLWFGLFGVLTALLGGQKPKCVYLAKKISGHRLDSALWARGEGVQMRSPP